MIKYISSVSEYGTVLTNGFESWKLDTRGLSYSGVEPSQVTGLTSTIVSGIAFGTTPGQIVLNWTVPSGNSISSYRVEGKANSAADSAFANINTNVVSNTLTVTKYDSTNSLVVGTSYDFRVKAVNRFGSGSVSTRATGTPVTVPAAPTSLTCTAGTSKVTLNWTAPSNGGSSITNHAIGYRDHSIGGAYTAFTAGSPFASSPVDVTGLSSSTSYDFSVAPINSSGTGIAVTNTVGTTPTSAASTTPTLASFAYRDVANLSTATSTINPASTTTGSGGFTSLPQGEDLIVMIVMSSVITSEAYPGPPSGVSAGFTFLRSHVGAVCQIDIYYKTAAGSRGNNTSDTGYSINTGGFTWAGYVHCFAIRGASTTPVIGASAFTGYQTSNTGLVAPSVTTSVANSLVITALNTYTSIRLTSIAQTYSGTTSRSIITFDTSATPTELTSQGYVTATKVIGSNGATGTFSHTISENSGATSRNSDGFTLIIS